LKVRVVLWGQTVVKAVTVVVTQVALVELWAETAAVKAATTASLVNCILTDLVDIKNYLKVMEDLRFL